MDEANEAFTNPIYFELQDIGKIGFNKIFRKIKHNFEKQTGCMKLRPLKDEGRRKPHLASSSAPGEYLKKAATPTTKADDKK